MDHDKCKENLSAYLDGELPAVERGLVEAHLADCPDCRAVLGQLNAVSGLVKKHVMEPVPASLEKKVLGGHTARPWFRPALAFATAAAVVMVVLNLNKTPENVYSPDLGYGSQVEIETLAATVEPAGDAAALSAEAAAPAPAPAAPAADYSGFSAESDKKSENQSAVAAVRGSLSQAKFAARAAAPVGAGSGGFASGYNSAARPAEFSGPVCVYVSEPGVLREAERATLDALAFLRQTCPKTVQAAPGAVFVKKDGSRKTVAARDCSYGFILFDGERDPLVLKDARAVPAEYQKYFAR